MQLYKIYFSRIVLGLSVFVFVLVGVMSIHTDVFAADTISSSVYQDINGDGAVDTILWTMDENVTSCLYNPSDWSVDEASEMNISIINVQCTGSDANLYIQLSADAGETGASTNPVISYTNNVNNIGLTAGPMTSKASQPAADNASPKIKSFGYMDSDADGKIDTIGLVFTETVGATSVLAPENLSLTNVGDFTSAAFGNSVTDVITLSGSTVTVPLGTEASVVDTYDDSGTLALSTVGTFSLIDISPAGNTYNTIEAQSGASTLDMAKPVISSSTPTDGSVGQSRTNAITFNFSEPMVQSFEASTDYDVSGPSGATGSNSLFATSGSWTDSDTVVASHTPLLCVYEYEFSSFTGGALAGTHGESGYTLINQASTAPIGSTLTFTTMACSSNTSEVEVPDPEISLLTPADGEELIAGEDYVITWESNNEGAYYVDLAYYLSDTNEYVDIATREINDGSYTWTLPAGLELDSTDIRLDWNDLADTLDIAFTDDFSIVTEATTSDDSSSIVDEISDIVGDMIDALTAINPFTGEEEDIDSVTTGECITSSETDAVYYIDIDGTRRPFMNSLAYFTWSDSWDDVVEVTGATLTQYSLGTPMLPQEGVVMVKIQSDNKVYAIEGDNTLRWVTSEQVAEDLYGTNWNEYIIDIEPTFFGMFQMGDDIEYASDYTALNGKTLKTRLQLHG